MRLKHTFLTLTLAATCASSAFANTANQDVMTQSTMTNVISLRTEVSRNIAHNFWQARLFTRHESQSLAEASNTTNATLAKALKILKGFKHVQIKENNISSYAHYNDKNAQDGWTVSGSLTLRSKDNLELSKALTALNGVMAVQSLSSGVTKNKIASIDDGMIKQALAQFEQKAAFIAKNLGATGYELVYANVGSPLSDSYGQSVMPRNYNLARANAATPVLGVEQSTFRAYVDGQIHLLNKTPVNLPK